MLARGTNRHFAHEITTSASSVSIWRLWINVAGWKHWDEGLADAKAERALALGATGWIFPKTGAKAAFEVTEFVEGQSYAFQTKLLLARLNVRRILISQKPTGFRHEISFTGPMAFFWATLLGPGFRKALPPTMATLAKLAAQKELSI